MSKKLKPKKENANTGFHYTVTDEQIHKHRKLTAGQVLDWLESTNKFIYELQTPAERRLVKKVKNFKHR